MGKDYQRSIWNWDLEVVEGTEVMRNRMNIFLTTSKQSIRYAYPAIVSLFKCNRDSEIYLYVASEDLTEGDIPAEMQVAQECGHHIIICRFDEARAREQIVCSTTGHWPIGAMSCYWMFHELLPKEVERILAIEADTVTIGSVKEFYETDLNGYYAACPDAEHKPLTHKEQMDMLGGDVLTFVASIYNVKKIRQDFTLQDILQTDKKISAIYGQSQMELTFGLLFHGKIKYLSAPEYSVEQNRQSMERFGYEYLKNCEDTCKILHFSSTGAKEKPWNPTCIMPGYLYWWEYAKDSPYFKEYFEQQWKFYKRLDKERETAQRNRTVRNVLLCTIILIMTMETIWTGFLMGKWYVILLQMTVCIVAAGFSIGIRSFSICLQNRHRK